MRELILQRDRKGKLALNPKQRKFCECYARDPQNMANGMKCYQAAYGKHNPANEYQNDRQLASNLLKNSNVVVYINELLETDGLNDTFVDKQLLFLLSQQEDRNIKLGSIKEYNKLKSRIQEKVDITSGGKPIPILNGISNVHTDDSTTETPETEKKD